MVNDYYPYLKGVTSAKKLKKLHSFGGVYVSIKPEFINR